MVSILHLLNISRIEDLVPSSGQSLAANYYNSVRVHCAPAAPEQTDLLSKQCFTFNAIRSLSLRRLPWLRFKREKEVRLGLQRGCRAHRLNSATLEAGERWLLRKSRGDPV